MTTQTIEVCADCMAPLEWEKAEALVHLGGEVLWKVEIESFQPKGRPLKYPEAHGNAFERRFYCAKCYARKDLRPIDVHRVIYTYSLRDYVSLQVHEAWKTKLEHATRRQVAEHPEDFPLSPERQGTRPRPRI